jgi:hypothetical protein
MACNDAISHRFRHSLVRYYDRGRLWYGLTHLGHDPSYTSHLSMIGHLLFSHVLLTSCNANDKSALKPDSIHNIGTM